MTDWLDSDSIDFMLEDCHTWAVVGLSGNPDRTAYRIAELLQRRGKRIVPIHPDAPTVLGEQGYVGLKRRLLRAGPRFLLQSAASALG